MLASICLLSYNRPEYLQSTLFEIQKAGCPYELIVNDDGSTDYQNRKIIFEQLDNKKITTAIFNPINYNEGVGRSINKSFKVATGDILIKVDSDILFEQNWLATCLQIFANNENLGLLGLCHYHHDPVDYNKTLIKSHQDHTEHTHILGSVFAVRRKVYEEFGIDSYSESFSEDWDLMKKIEKHDKWYNGLPITELAHNYGMGFDKSTIAIEVGKTKSIHKETLKI